MAKRIMVLGTMSNVGKSIITGGLCRIFAQDGWRTAPFKSQNMALNSFITRDGLEMGRAQVMQAECAGIDPDVRMNPILLKPTSDRGSQVIVQGEVIGDMSAREYYAYKKKLRPMVMDAFQSLAAENDVIVIEGAGSPAEINLMEDDFVNLGLAEMVQAPCLLVGDIDRGGVFAQLYGTVKLVAPAEQSLIKGFLVNKFRGDVGILDPGLRQLENLAERPVLGVVPYCHLNIDDEDSLSDRLNGRRETGLIDIVVIRYPRISNFTDLNLFQNLEGVSVRYISSSDEFKNPDLVILPGSKDTMGDLLWMRQSGLENRVLKFAHGGGPVFGICGGYQMLGQELVDPSMAEGKQKLGGMNLLPVRSVFMEEKIRTRVTGVFSQVGGVFQNLSGRTFEGYEIHMGITEGLNTEIQPLSVLQQNGEDRMDGFFHENVYGSYVHGIFDRAEIVEAVITRLCDRKGIERLSVTEVDWEEIKMKEYDRLADVLRQHLNMEEIYKVLEQGVDYEYQN